jgi:ABC-type transport system involved in cytochrome c biogenesis ATPase subunit
MNIKFTGKEKSLEDFEWNNIPELSVITGMNGAGKTQILNLINSTYRGWKLIAENKYLYKNPNYELEVSDIIVENNSVLFWSSNGTHINIENSKFGYKDLKFIVTFLKNHINGLNEDNKKLLNPETNPGTYEDHTLGKNKLKNVLNNKKDKIINYLEQEVGKSKTDLTPAEISYYFPEEILLEDFDLFNQDSLDFIFFMYLYKREAKIKYQLSISINDKTPWDILNDVLKEANLPYELTFPKKELITPIFENALNDVKTDRFNVKLINPLTNEDIGFNNLSSGERIIASLALLLYYTQNRNQNKSLLILDEPDAHLHPTLTKQFFDVIKNVIIEKHNGRVIMSTHSPSTIALAPKDSIFLVQKDNPRISKTSKDSALSILSSGVPSFSVNYENRRQVFVESPYDVIYYEKIYNKIKKNLIPEISLTFISSGDSRTDKNGIKVSNCDQVINITKVLRDAGNKFIWGIVDWDTKNKTEDSIKVLGEGKRYSIENYILDPILVTALLLREKKIDRSDINLDEDQNYTDFTKLNIEQIQFISDFFIDKIGKKIKSKPEEKSTIQLLNGMKINMPKWYLHYQGHKLENIILETFPSLNSIKLGKEEALKVAIIEKIIDDIPELMSIDFLETFKYIQN